ncbi:MAG: exonuclease domain-containing protein [Holophagaceae bacterium]|nr:exonuclease domain-containing protein [Holophagaceae bacterium]
MCEMNKKQTNRPVIAEPDDTSGLLGHEIDNEKGGERQKKFGWATVDQYIIFDLEATCWDGPRDESQCSEVIEIGAVKLDASATHIDTLQTFIRPTINPVLSAFCIDLTSIQQNDVDHAPSFSEAMDTFAQWICKGSTDIMLVSFGHYDKNQILEESKAKGYSGDIVRLLDNHRSIKHDLADLRKVRVRGLKRTLRMLGIPHDGTLHRGIDDAMNTAKIFRVVFDEWKEMVIRRQSNG